MMAYFHLDAIDVAASWRAPPSGGAVQEVTGVGCVGCVQAAAGWAGCVQEVTGAGCGASAGASSGRVHEVSPVVVWYQ